MRKVAVIGVPMDLGQNRRGVDMGPSALRYTGLDRELASLGHCVTDHGNVAVPVAETLGKGSGKRPGGLVYLEAIRDACEDLAGRLEALPGDVTPIVLGGDHSVAVGSVAGASRGERTGLIWVDAHADFNTPETSPSGNVHGMALAALCGQGERALVEVGGEGATVSPEDVVLIGLRSVDPGERDLLRSLGVLAFTMKEVDHLGMARIAEETLERLSGLTRLHLSLDADALEPEIAPGVGTPVTGGLSYREAHLLMELLADASVVTSLDLVEVNPILDRENRTAVMMKDLAASLLGKTIL